MESDTALNCRLALLALLCLGIHLSYFFLIKTFVPSIDKDRRKLSWILTLVTAIVVSCGGCYALGMHIRTTFSSPVPYEEYSDTPGTGFFRWDIAYTPAAFQKQSGTEEFPHFIMQTNEADGVWDIASSTEARIAFYKAYDHAQAAKPWYRRAVFFDTRFQPADSPEGQFFTIFFAMYLVADLTCGVRYYKDKITFLSGWAHHISYLITAYYAVFIAKESHTFSACFVIEIPTVLIGLGFVDKRLRNDMLFGMIYVLFRIFFDFSLTHEYVFGRPDMWLTTKIIVCSKSLLHIQFLSDWIKQQIRLRRKAAPAVVTALPVKSPKLDIKDASNLGSSTSCASDIDPQDEHLSTQMISVEKFGKGGKGVAHSAMGVATTSTHGRSIGFVKSTMTRRRVPSAGHNEMESKASMLAMEDYILQNPVAVR